MEDPIPEEAQRQKLDYLGEEMEKNMVDDLIISLHQSWIYYPANRLNAFFIY